MTSTVRRVVRERIDPRLTASLFSNYRTAIDALLELIDNAVDARLEGQTLQVDLALRPGSLALTAVGGWGMSPDQLERQYLRWGASPKRAGERIGRFGQGGKAAIGHLGNRFEIVVSPIGDESAYAFSDDSYRDRTRLRSYDVHVRTKPVDSLLGYVHIEVGEIDKRLDPLRARLRLAEVYRPLLLSGQIAARVNRVPVEPLAWPLVEEKPVSVRAGGRIVRGWYGLLPDPPPLGLVPGVRIYHLGRLIGDPVWFGHQGPGLHPALARLVGEVELPNVAVTMNKSDVERDSAVWAEVDGRLHRLLAPIVRRLTREQGPAASPQALRTADHVRKILARALRMLESGELFESPTAAGSAGPPGQLTLDQVHAPGDQADRRPEVPLAPASDPNDLPPRPQPPSPTSPQGGGSRRGFGDVVIRALDPRVRSSTIEEDGVRRVVINSQYPLYDLRKGDLWYQLETALREVCVTIPEATVPEFERKVNDLMLISLSFADRRRKRRRQAQPAKGSWASP